jgi:hypothetical protein
MAEFWANTASLRALLWNAGVTIVRGDIGWSIASAELVGEAIQRIGERFGGDVRRFIGGVTIVMQSRVAPWWERIRDPNASFGGYEYWGTVYLAPISNLPGILHEMGHYFDEKAAYAMGHYFVETQGHSLWKYKRHLRRAGLSTEFASEDFANAFANYALRVSDPCRDSYMNQFWRDEISNAGGYIWADVGLFLGNRDRPN